MIKTFLLAGLLAFSQWAAAQSRTAVQPYVAFLSGEQTSAKTYILDLFKTHDVVILCERLHPEFTQYGLIMDVVSDPWFQENVGNVFTEVGVSTLNPALNNFLETPGLPPDTVRNRVLAFQRDCSIWPIWDLANYSWYVEKVYQLDQQLPPGKRIHLFPSDLPFRWEGADSNAIAALWKAIPVRDSIIAAQIITCFDSLGRQGDRPAKALVIMNYRHAFNQSMPAPGGQSVANVSGYLFHRFGDRAANVMINSILPSDTSLALLQGGKWDAAFAMASKRDLGFDFSGSPFGLDSFDYWPFHSSFRYQDVFTGLAFYLPVEDHQLSEGVPGLEDSTTLPELLRRVDLTMRMGVEFRAKMQNVRKALDQNGLFMDTREDRPYFNIDRLKAVRATWMQ